jgi:hypothetical protein
MISAGIIAKAWPATRNGHPTDAAGLRPARLTMGAMRLSQA